jgi:F-type H+-transporting ATPase subunit delta
MRDVANGVLDDVTVQHFLESPKISEAQKNEVFFQALGDRVPRHFLRFLQTLVRKRRQMLIPEISSEYDKLLDIHEGRVHANVTVARESSLKDENLIAEQLSRVIGKTVVPHMTVNPAILGGVVVKIGDTVMDGSVRRRLSRLKGQLVAR